MIIRHFEQSGNQNLWHCFWLSFFFFVVYFLIHVLLNIAELDEYESVESHSSSEVAQICESDVDGKKAATELKIQAQKRDTEDQKSELSSAPFEPIINDISNAMTSSEPEALFKTGDAKDLAGPFSISLCSSLLIFSFSAFLLQGMQHLSVSAPFSFLKAFFIFVVGLILIQIAGHAEIFRYSREFDIQTPNIKKIIEFMSTATLPIAFFTLYLLERYQANVYAAVSDQLPDAVFTHHPHPRALAFFTGLSIFFSFVKSALHYYELVMFVEVGISALVVLVIFRPDLIPSIVAQKKEKT